MLTLNQLIQKINDLQEASALLGDGSFLFGDPWEYGASNTIQYPLLGLRLISTSVNDTIHTTSFNMFYCDKVNKDESNETQVLSDMQMAALRLYSELRLDFETNDLTYPAKLSITSSLTPFTEKFDDEVSGMEMNINIEQHFDKSTCD